MRDGHGAGPVGQRCAVAVGWVLVLLAALPACGAGQEAQTANQVTASGGAAGRVGSILVRDAHLVWNGPVQGDTVYEVGADAPIQLTIINTVDDGMAADRLVAVRSPVATSGRITGDARIPDGQVLTAGYAKPAAAGTVPPEGTVDILLTGLTSPIRAGLTYPVVFTFERAGDLRLELPVENPGALPPGADDEEPDKTSTLEAGPDIVVVPR